MEFLNKKQKIILIIILTIMCATIIYYIFNKTMKSDYEEFEEVIESAEESAEEFTQEQDNIIVVYVVGEVQKSGIVELQEGARIADAIDKAGGATINADLSKVNLAYILEDGQKITIPGLNDETLDYVETEAGEDVLEENVKQSKVNINTASQTELETLTGIGPSTALKIIEYRKANGDFKQKEDIKNVSGIGESKYNAIKDEIQVK